MSGALANSSVGKTGKLRDSKVKANATVEYPKAKVKIKKVIKKTLKDN